MALKRGFCTHCEGDEKLRIFNVNKEAEVCYCPYCTSPMQPKDAIDNYRNLIAHYLKQASRYLFETTEYLRAYQTFAHIIDLDDTIKVAYLGRILALVHLSTLRKSKINFALLMHKQQASRMFHYQEIANEYYHFLALLLDALDIYENKMKKRLTSRNVYYDIDCVVLSLKRIEEINSYRMFLMSEAQYFIDSGKSQFREIVERISHYKKHYENAFKEKYLTADGNTYLFNEFGPNLTPVLTLQSGGRNPQRVHHIKEGISLYPKDNKKSAIRDDIYLNNLPLSRLVRVSLPLEIVLVVLAVIGFIFAAVNEDKIIKTLLFVGAAAFTSMSFVLIILHFAWSSTLKKKYYNGTNPFIFK